MNFRKAVREASREAELMFQERFKLRLVLAIPAYRRQLEEELLLKAVQHSVVPASMTLDADTQDVDWEVVKDFIIEWLPVILRLIVLFI